MYTTLLKDELNIKNLVLLSVLTLIMVYLSAINFVLFHTTIEFFCVLVAFNMFTLSINTYKYNTNFSMMFLGIAFGFVGILDLLHTLTFEGVSVLLRESINLSSQFWIAARMVESISILIACGLINRRYSNNKIKYVGITYF